MKKLGLFNEIELKLIKEVEEGLIKCTPEEMAEKCAEEFIKSPDIKEALLNYKYFTLFNLTFDKLSALLIEKGILSKSEWEKIESECGAEAQAEFDKQCSEIKAEKKAEWQKKFEEIKAEMDKWRAKS